MCNVWRQCQEEYPEMSAAIDEGIEKLELYISRTDLVPAHVLSMSAFPPLFVLSDSFTLCSRGA
jgi:hypothetical protein